MIIFLHQSRSQTEQDEYRIIKNYSKLRARSKYAVFAIY